MRKRLGIIFIIAAVCLTVISCGQEILVSTPGGSYEFQGAELMAEYGGVQADAANGQSILLVQLRTENAALEDIVSSFFDNGQSKAQVSDGTAAIPCKAVSYSKANGNDAGFTLRLLFEVPSTFLQEFTLSGEAFSTVSLKHK